MVVILANDWLIMDTWFRWLFLFINVCEGGRLLEFILVYLAEDYEN